MYYETRVELYSLVLFVPIAKAAADAMPKLGAPIAGKNGLAEIILFSWYVLSFEGLLG